MASKILCHQVDAAIDRESFPFEAWLCDEEGLLLYSFPTEMSDEHIRKALDFANKAFNQGRKFGRKEKRDEVRAALGLDPL